MLIVQKFGGSSLADPVRLRRVAGICAEARKRGNQLVAVVSAAGDSTDALLETAHKIHPHPPLRELDALMATGEQRSAALMAIMLESLGHAARSFSGWQAGIHTDTRHGEAAILRIEPRRLLETLAEGKIAVVAGFQGVSPREDVTTLGRGQRPAGGALPAVGAMRHPGARQLGRGGLRDLDSRPGAAAPGAGAVPPGRDRINERSGPATWAAGLRRSTFCRPPEGQKGERTDLSFAQIEREEGTHIPSSQSPHACRSTAAWLWLHAAGPAAWAAGPCNRGRGVIQFQQKQKGTAP